MAINPRGTRRTESSQIGTNVQRRFHLDGTPFYPIAAFLRRSQRRRLELQAEWVEFPSDGQLNRSGGETADLRTSACECSLTPQLLWAGINTNGFPLLVKHLHFTEDA